MERDIIDANEEVIFIYALADPRDHLIRYIGQSADPVKRLKSHLTLAQGSQQKRDWLRDLKRLKLKPVLHTIETVKGYLAADEREQYWMGYYQAHGQVLTNFLPRPNLHLLTQKDSQEETMPQGYLNITEAARKYHITEKTIRSWITKRLLPAHTVVIRGLNQYAIATADIEAVIAQKAMSTEEPETTSYPIQFDQELQRIVTKLEQRVTELERKLDTLLQLQQENKVSDQMGEPVKENDSHPVSRGSEVPKNAYQPEKVTESSALPPGSVDLAPFCVKHGITRSRVKRYINVSPNRVTPIGGYDFLTDQQQERFYQFFHTYTGFKPCPDCPHEAK